MRKIKLGEGGEGGREGKEGEGKGRQEREGDSRIVQA